MALTEFTTFNDIRAALGVTSDELQDTTLSLKLYEFGLTADLESVDLTLSEQYSTVSALPSPSAAQTRFLEATQLFSTYSVARALLGSLPMFAFKEVTDGKAIDTRFALDPYKETTKRVEAQFAQTQERLRATLAALTSTTVEVVRRSFLAVASPTRDPILGT
jgi:hypothetical protein